MTISKMLLLDGYSTRSLACVRSWGARDVPFAVGGETARDMSLLSRHARETFVYTSPKRDVRKFIADVNEQAQRFGAGHVFPTSEATILACSEHRAHLHCTPIIPSDSEIATVFSKANTLAIAESVGVLTPKTVHVTAANVASVGALSLTFPVAIKSSSSQVMIGGRAETSGSTAYAFSKAEVERECAARIAKGQSVLVQEFIDGYGVGVSGLFWQGRPAALLAHRRIRESNPTGGPSALAETIPLDPALLEPTQALFERIGFTGPAMAEYKVDRRSNKPYLMEINGRFWGSVLLASAAGLDLPYLYWKLLNGMPIDDQERRYRLGVRGRNLIGDSTWLLLCLKGVSRSWPGEVVNRGAAIRSYLGSFLDRQTTDMIFSVHDPLPFLGRLLQPNS